MKHRWGYAHNKKISWRSSGERRYFYTYAKVPNTSQRGWRCEYVKLWKKKMSQRTRRWVMTGGHNAKYVRGDPTYPTAKAAMVAAEFLFD